MISTYGELVAAIKTWLVTPLKWERKVKEQTKDVYHSVFDTNNSNHKRISDLMSPGTRNVFDRELARHEYEQRRYTEYYKRQASIPFCDKCKDVGCDECKTWPMNQ